MDNKYQKALENLKQFNKHRFPVASLHSYFQTQLDSLQELVDKEKPMKVKKNDLSEEFSMYGCPKCDRLVTDIEKPDYCPACGQKLDWSDYD